MCQLLCASMLLSRQQLARIDAQDLHELLQDAGHVPLSELWARERQRRHMESALRSSRGRGSSSRLPATASNAERWAAFERNLRPNQPRFAPFDDGVPESIISDFRSYLDLAHAPQAPQATRSGVPGLGERSIASIPERRSDAIGVEECAICLTRCAPDVKLAELDCGHAFHRSCLAKWLRRTGSCPCCRRLVMPVARATHAGHSRHGGRGRSADRSVAGGRGRGGRSSRGRGRENAI